MNINEYGVGYILLQRPRSSVLSACPSWILITQRKTVIHALVNYYYGTQFPFLSTGAYLFHFLHLATSKTVWTPRLCSILLSFLIFQVVHYLQHFLNIKTWRFFQHPLIPSLYIWYSLFFQPKSEFFLELNLWSDSNHNDFIFQNSQMEIKFQKLYWVYSRFINISTSKYGIAVLDLETLKI